MDTKHLASTIADYRTAADAQIDATADAMMAALADWLELHGATKVEDGWYVEPYSGATLRCKAPINVLQAMSRALRAIDVIVSASGPTQWSRVSVLP